MTDEAASESTEGRGERRWLRPVGLFLLAFGLALGEPTVTVFVTFAFLTLLRPGRRVAAIGLAAVATALVFAGGQPSGGLWYLERGWAIVVAGGFVAISMVWPNRPFFPRALWAVGVGLAASAGLLLAVNGWETVETLMAMRIEEGGRATLQLTEWLAPGPMAVQLSETVRQTGRLQGILFPSLVALSTLASLGVAWWLYLRATIGSDRGLEPFREFRFPDPMIWLFIAGIALVLVAEWTVGWGRTGTNLMTFVGALYVLRGLGVLLFVFGGVSLGGGILIGVTLLLAAQVFLAAALVIGVGDSWIDIRSRVASAGRKEIE